MFRLWPWPCPSIIRRSIWRTIHLSCKYTGWSKTFWNSLPFFYFFELTILENAGWSWFVCWQIHKRVETPLFRFNWISREKLFGFQIIICSRLLQLFARLWSEPGLEWIHPASHSLLFFSSLFFSFLFFLSIAPLRLASVRTGVLLKVLFLLDHSASSFSFLIIYSFRCSMGGSIILLWDASLQDLN